MYKNSQSQVGFSLPRAFQWWSRNCHSPSGLLANWFFVFMSLIGNLAVSSILMATIYQSHSLVVILDICGAKMTMTTVHDQRAAHHCRGFPPDARCYCTNESPTLLVPQLTWILPMHLLRASTEGDLKWIALIAARAILRGVTVLVMIVCVCTSENYVVRNQYWKICEQFSNI